MAQPPRFLVEQPLTAPGEFVLSREESHHAAAVLRLREGDAVVLFDGRGGFADAVIAAVRKGSVVTRAGEPGVEPPFFPELTVAAAIPKGKRWQALVEKCVELGADCIAPVLFARSVAKGEGDASKWRRWCVEAAKQSRRCRLPEVEEPVPLSVVLERAVGEGSVLLLADPGGDPGDLRETLASARRVTVLIGPEGGLSDDETALCLARGAKPLRLGPFILRIETAAMAACAVVRSLSDRG